MNVLTSLAKPTTHLPTILCLLYFITLTATVAWVEDAGATEGSKMTREVDDNDPTVGIRYPVLLRSGISNHTTEIVSKLRTMSDSEVTWRRQRQQQMHLIQQQQQQQQQQLQPQHREESHQLPRRHAASSAVNPLRAGQRSIRSLGRESSPVPSRSGRRQPLSDEDENDNEKDEEEEEWGSEWTDDASGSHGMISHERWEITPTVGQKSGSGSFSPERCDDARVQCTVRTGCQMALNNFFQGCGTVVSGEERRCTRGCKHALLSLLATEDGAGLAFINCHCGPDSECQQRKQRVEICQRQVLDSLDLVRHDDGRPVNCGFARWLCEADTSCLAALRYYLQHCGQLFAGLRCSPSCRNSLRILYRQPNAHKLRHCRCEGDETYDCARLMENTERLCFPRQSQSQQPGTSGTGQHNDPSYSSSGANSTRSQPQQSSVSRLHVGSHDVEEVDYVSDGGDDEAWGGANAGGGFSRDYEVYDADLVRRRKSKGTQRQVGSSAAPRLLAVSCWCFVQLIVPLYICL